MPTLEDVHDLREQIRELDAAISAARGGATYSLGGRSVSRQQLPDLQAERGRLVRSWKQAHARLEGATTPDITVASWDRV